MRRLTEKERYFYTKAIEKKVKNDEERIKDLEADDNRNFYDEEELAERKESFKWFSMMFDWMLDDDEPEMAKEGAE